MQQWAALSIHSKFCHASSCLLSLAWLGKVDGIHRLSLCVDAQIQMHPPESSAASSRDVAVHLDICLRTWIETARSSSAWVG